MLRSITLNPFGMFKQRSFGITALTVFYGPNQSGKTTIMDALRMQLFKQHQGRSAEAQHLSARYGRDQAWQVNLQWEKAALEHSNKPASHPNKDMFSGLFLARAGDFLLDFQGSWLDTVRHALFSGGVDPQALHAQFDRMLSSDKRSGLARDKAKKESELEDVEGQLSEKNGERDAILSQQQQQKQAGQLLAELAQSIQNLSAQHQQRTQQAQRQQNQRTGQTLKKNLARLQQWQRLYHQQQSALGGQTLQQLEQYKTRLQRCVEERARLESPLSPPVFSGFQAAYFFGWAGVLLLPSLFLIFLSFGEVLAGVGWKFGGFMGVLFGLLALVVGGVRKVDKNQALQRYQADYGAKNEALRNAIAGENEAKRGLEGFFARHGAADENAFYQRLAHENTLAKEVDALEKWIKQQAARLKEADVDALRARWEREFNALPTKDVSEGAIDERAITETQRQKENVFAELEEAKQTYQELDRRQYGDSRERHGRLGKLPEELDLLEKRQHALKNDVSHIEAQRDAARLAKEVLEEIDMKSNSVFNQLASTVSTRYASLSGLFNAKQAVAQAVELNALNAQELRARDKQQRWQLAEHLSHGAQHMLHLALRLELATQERHHAPAIFCWDEPFAHMDAENQQHAIAMIAQTLAQQPNWQMLVFTCQKTQVESFQDHAPQATIHHLESNPNQAS